MKYAFIREHRHAFAVAPLCRLMHVSRSGFHAWLQRGPSQRVQRDAQLLLNIRRIHVEHRSAYGAIKTWHALEARGIPCGKHRVARLRREGGVEVKRQQRQRLTVEHHQMAAAAPDLLVRNFRASLPNRVWAGDMTFIRTREGWLHLAVLLDLFSRKVVGWAMDQRPGQVLHVGALTMAVTTRRPQPGLIHHTDRGSQYRSGAYRAVLATHGILPSMNGRKVPQDKAVAESFFSTLKNELVHQCDFKSREEARAAIRDFIVTFYNRTRIHQSLGYQSPDQFERQARGA